MLNRDKYKRLPDLYRVGTEVVFEDDSVIWLQATNAFEQDEARHDAQVARSRLVMALKGEHGSPERDSVIAQFLLDGRSTAIERLLNLQGQKWSVQFMLELDDDPDWQEKLEIIRRSDELMAREPDDAERKLLEDIAGEYMKEVEARFKDHSEYTRRKYESMTDEELSQEYIDLYVENRGRDVAQAEMMLTEIWYGARCCEAKKVGETWDHSACDGHKLRVWEDKKEVRDLPEGIFDKLAVALTEVSMTVRDSKNSDRQQSSSGSSPLPSAEGESTPSSSTETQASLLGTS